MTILRNELIQLITIKGSEKEEGFKIKEDTITVEIFAEIQSVGRTQFYGDLRNGINVNIIFAVEPEDFKLGIVRVDGIKIKPSKVIYDGDEYIIKRTYLKKSSGLLEITCSEVE